MKQSRGQPNPSHNLPYNLFTVNCSSEYKYFLHVYSRLHDHTHYSLAHPSSPKLLHKRPSTDRAQAVNLTQHHHTPEGYAKL